MPIFAHHIGNSRLGRQIGPLRKFAPRVPACDWFTLSAVRFLRDCTCRIGSLFQVTMMSAWWTPDAAPGP